jgi:hypothetical protein
MNKASKVATGITALGAVFLLPGWERMIRRA